eukprot:6858744-Prymnesium_polylepis.1
MPWLHVLSVQHSKRRRLFGRLYDPHPAPQRVGALTGHCCSTVATASSISSRRCDRLPSKP